MGEVMFNKLVILADKLDNLGLSKDADFIDDLIQKIGSEEEWVDEPTKITDYEAEPLDVLQKLDEDVLDPEISTFGPNDMIESTPLLTGIDITSKLKQALGLLPDPDKWSEKHKEKILNLMNMLREIL
jgi:hypothetical protein